MTDNGALEVGAVDRRDLTLDDGTTVTGDGSGTLTINSGARSTSRRGRATAHGATLDGVGDR